MLTVRFFRTRSRTRWWEIEDNGGWPPGAHPPYSVRVKYDGFPPAWPDGDWSLRPHP